MNWTTQNIGNINCSEVHYRDTRQQAYTSLQLWMLVAQSSKKKNYELKAVVMVKGLAGRCKAGRGFINRGFVLPWS